MEAKLTALEERISFLTEASESLEWRFEHAVERWVSWSVELREALSTIAKHLDRIRRHIPLPPAK
jgi:hypothetical protein